MNIDLVNPENSLHKMINFPDGHKHIDLSAYIDFDEITSIDIKMRIINGDDLFILSQISNFIKENAKKNVSTCLIITYLLASRYDRKMNALDTFDLKLVCKQINSYGFDTVIVYEPHSNVTTTLLDNCKTVLPLNTLVASYLKLDPLIVLVAPDLGAVKRLETFQTKYQVMNDTIILNKRRDIPTGKILGIETLKLHSGLRDRAFIYDDLCDGGATFLHAAKHLRQIGFTDVRLAITHSIFSAGVPKLLTKNDEGFYLDAIITTNSYKDHEPYPNLTVNEL